MKNPKWKCAYPNSHKVKFGGKFLTQWDGYHLTLEQSTGGTISADKFKGYQGQSANLSYTADTFYHFNGWNSTGANIQNNQVQFTADTTAKANFVYDPIPTSGQAVVTSPRAGVKMTWAKYDLDYDDGGPGIIRVEHPIYKYKYYANEDDDGTILTVQLPYSLCYYTLEAAHRVANKINGWHLPTMQDWTVYVGVEDNPHYGYWYTVSRESRRYFPSGAYYDVGSTIQEFDTMPNSNYKMMYKFMNSANYYVDKIGLNRPTYLNLVSNWWIASAVSNAGNEIWSVTVDSDKTFRAEYGNSAEYKPVRLLKDGSIIQPY